MGADGKVMAALGEVICGYSLTEFHPNRAMLEKKLEDKSKEKIEQILAEAAAVQAPLITDTIAAPVAQAVMVILKSYGKRTFKGGFKCIFIKF